MKDPIVDELRGFREEHAKRFNYDLDAIFEDFKTHQNRHADRLVRLKSNKLATTEFAADAKTSKG